MKVKTFIDIDRDGQNWPLIQFGPIENENEARAMLETMREFFSQHFAVPVEPLH